MVKHESFKSLKVAFCLRFVVATTSLTNWHENARRSNSLRNMVSISLAFIEKQNFLRAFKFAFSLLFSTFTSGLAKPCNFVFNQSLLFPFSIFSETSPMILYLFRFALPWSQRLSFILSFLFGNLRREALIEAPSPREKKASGQDR